MAANVWYYWKVKDTHSDANILLQYPQCLALPWHLGGKKPEYSIHQIASIVALCAVTTRLATMHHSKDKVSQTAGTHPRLDEIHQQAQTK